MSYSSRIVSLLIIFFLIFTACSKEKDALNGLWFHSEVGLIEFVGKEQLKFYNTSLKTESLLEDSLTYIDTSIAFSNNGTSLILATGDSLKYNNESQTLEFLNGIFEGDTFIKVTKEAKQRGKKNLKKLQGIWGHKDFEEVIIKGDNLTFITLDDDYNDVEKSMKITIYDSIIHIHDQGLAVVYSLEEPILSLGTRKLVRYSHVFKPSNEFKYRNAHSKISYLDDKVIYEDLKGTYDGPKLEYNENLPLFTIHNVLTKKEAISLLNKNGINQFPEIPNVDSVKSESNYTLFYIQEVDSYDKETVSNKTVQILCDSLTKSVDSIITFTTDIQFPERQWITIYMIKTEPAVNGTDITQFTIYPGTYRNNRSDYTLFNVKFNENGTKALKRIMKEDLFLTTMLYGKIHSFLFTDIFELPHPIKDENGTIEVYDMSQGALSFPALGTFSFCAPLRSGDLTTVMPRLRRNILNHVKE